MFSLGMLAFRLFAGEKDAWTKDERRSALINAGVTRQKADLIVRMLSENPSERPSNAREVQSQLNNAERPLSRLARLLLPSINIKRPILAVSIISLLVGAAFLVSSWFLILSRGEVEQNRSQIEKIKSDFDDLSDKAQMLDRETQARLREVDSLKKANKNLQARFDSANVELDTARVLIKRLQEDDTKKQLSLVIKELNKWKNSIEELNKEKDNLKNRLGEIGKVFPLHSNGDINAQKFAQREWSRMATNGTLTQAQMNKEIQEYPHPSVKRYLVKWYDGMETPPEHDGQKDKWWIGLVSARAGNSNLGDRDRKLEIKVNGIVVTGERHRWSSSNDHKYDTRHWTAFEWKPGDVITVCMKYDPGALTGWRSIVEKSFDGPMALWRLAAEHVDDRYGARIEIEIWGISGKNRPSTRLE